MFLFSKRSLFYTNKIIQNNTKCNPTHAIQKCHPMVKAGNEGIVLLITSLQKRNKRFSHFFFFSEVLMGTISSLRLYFCYFFFSFPLI